MLNSLIQPYPEVITIDGKDYEVYTDFRKWIALTEALLDKELNTMELFIVLTSVFINEKPEMTQETIQQIVRFLNGNTGAKKGKQSKKRNKRVLSFDMDCDCIIAAFMQCYHIDLISVQYMHWWHFLALLYSLDDCEMKRRMDYRSINVSNIKDKKERARIRKIQSDIAIPSSEIDEDRIASAFD